MEGIFFTYISPPCISPKANQKIIGIRPGEKLHEQMIGTEDSPYTYDYKGYYKILPAIHGWSNDPLRIGDGVLVDSNFSYTSDSNLEWMSIESLRQWISINESKIGSI